MNCIFNVIGVHGLHFLKMMLYFILISYQFHSFCFLFSLLHLFLLMRITGIVLFYLVKFVFEAFKKLRPGIPLKCLHGRMKQERRMGIYAQFCEKRSVLFSTDVASRGLDFNKAVDWVVQVRFWLFKEATSVL